MATLKTFVHPHEVYRLQYPAHWEHLEKDEARSCGFGPHERDDVGLWISILPMSLDTERIIDELPKVMEQMLSKTGEMRGANVHQDKTLKQFGIKADIVGEGEGGHYWVLAGGDVVLFASTQVPVGERDLWNSQFEAVMASLRITREDALFYRRIANDVLQKLRARFPDENFQHDEKGIRGNNQLINLDNVYREVKESPKRREHIIDHFVDGLSQSVDSPMGYEEWDDIKGNILPMLKPRDYIRADTPTRHLQTSEWLADVVICYVIRSKKFFRFVTDWDVNRWGTTPEILHDLAIANLARLPWPKKLEGSRQRDGGRLILVLTDDSLGSSRLLHPELHRLFAGPLGSPFWAGIPDRDTLVLFSDRRNLKKQVGRQIRKDFFKSAYAITPRPFLVTPDGIAPGEEE